MSSLNPHRGYLGNILHTKQAVNSDIQLEEIESGALLIDESGRITHMGPGAELRRDYPEVEWHDYHDQLIIPGLIDAHIHFPQMDMIGSYGEELLGWLTRYTYPSEMKFSDSSFAEACATRFCQELLANGTTMAASYSSSHEQATDSLFRSMASAGMRGIIGKISMNRHAPQGLLNQNEEDLEQCQRLITKWHGYENRLFYAITPRFAPSCTNELLRDLGQLHREFPTTYIQTHYAETKDEIAWVASLFPDCADYLQVYEHAELVNSQTLLGHGIHLTQSERTRLATYGTKIVHCPTSNMFLGSGLIALDELEADHIQVMLGTDVGAGTSFSMFATMRACYNIQKLRGQTVCGTKLLHLATLGSARALGLDHQIGNFQKGKDADFVVLDWRKHRLLKQRLEEQQTAEEKIFATIFLGDDRIVDKVYVRGKQVYEQQPN